MSKLEKTISELREDLTPLDISREEFLALQAKLRIEEQSRKYNDEFDRLLKSLEVQEFNEREVDRMIESLKIFSDTISVWYSKLISEIGIYQENIFNKFS